MTQQRFFTASFENEKVFSNLCRHTMRMKLFSGRSGDEAKFIFVFRLWIFVMEIFESTHLCRHTQLLQTFSYEKKVFAVKSLLEIWNFGSGLLCDWLGQNRLRWLRRGMDGKWGPVRGIWCQFVLLQRSSLDRRVRSHLVVRREGTRRMWRERTTTNGMRLAPIECRSSYNIFIYIFSKEHETKINR